MERRSLEAIFRALNKAEARYLVVGGVAVNAHGHYRLTVDLDLVLDLEPENARRALAALAKLGYRSQAPVPLTDFADAEQRERWLREKGLLVFSLFSDAHDRMAVDLFVRPPFDFEPAYARALRHELRPGLTVTIAGLDDLLTLKKQAGRPKDLEDVRVLELLRWKREEDRKDG
jgi:hypothetical protein